MFPYGESSRDHPIMTDHTTSQPDVPEPEIPGSDAIEVLHVEPDSRSAELLATFAAQFAERITVKSIERIETAFEAVAAADCVVTEQRLPDGSGVELVERLRATGHGLPVVFHTTCRGEDVEAAARGAGADAYFEKRSERGQYDRILERVRRLVDGEGRRSGRTATTATADAPRTDPAAFSSKE